MRPPRPRIGPLPALTILVMLGPVAAGLWGTLLPALGHLPSAGARGPSLVAVRALLDWPGLAAAIRLSLTTGALATLLSLAITLLLLAGWSGTRAFGWIERALSPLLSVPHAAVAFALAFLIAPSGWLARLVSPWLTGWTRPPDLLILNDPLGLSLTAGLVLKEVPFLLLMSLAALPQTDAARGRRVAAALGYGRVAGWFAVVLPRLYPQIRLPVWVVLAYSMTVVDVALILGPTAPPPLSVQILRWMSDPDLGRRMPAAVAALLQLALVIAALALWRAGEGALARLGRRRLWTGRRGRRDGALRGIGLAAAGSCAGLALAGLAGLGLWSLAAAWRFPDALPGTISLATWSAAAPGLGPAALTTAGIAAAATLAALVLVLGCLETETRRNRPLTPWGLRLIYLPLLVPQVAFLPGLQTFLLSLGIATGPLPVILAHLVFVLPYLFLSLGGPWRALDPRTGRIAAALGATPGRTFWRIRLPMLLRPVLTAAAVGLAVSVGQYLPTLLAGGGRVATLTTEAVALAAGGDRRLIAVHGLAQTAAALLPFAAATAIPALVWRNRRGMHG